MLANMNLDIPKMPPVTSTRTATFEIVSTKESRHKTTEEIVREYYEADPILANIASCESNFRQFDKDGDVLKGRVNEKDVGVMQINIKYHLETSKKLGIDIYTLEGNLKYGKYLYETQGTSPWNASSLCWIPRSNLAFAR